MTTLTGSGENVLHYCCFTISREGLHLIIIVVVIDILYRSHVAPLWSWMEKVLPTLDKSDPVHGDISTVEALMGAHSVRVCVCVCVCVCVYMM